MPRREAAALSMSGELHYGPPTDEREVDSFAAIATAALLSPADPRTPDDIRAHLATFGGEVRLVRSGGRVAGGLASFSGGQRFGGRAVPSDGVGLVAIAPEHRGRGAAALLMRSHVRELRSRGVALSALYPATLTLYRRAGYELAGSHHEYEIPLSGWTAAKSDGVEIRPMTSADREAVVELHRARVAHASGPIERPPFVWKRLLEKSGARELRYVLVHGAACEGYVTLTHEPAGSDRYDIRVTDYAFATARAAAALLGLLARSRSMALGVRFAGAPVEPLIFAMTEQHGCVVRRRTEWMLRIVDVEKALELRGYPSGVRAELHLDVRDDDIAENAGRWVLALEEGRARVERGGRGDVQIDVLALASLYSGYLSADDLARVGRLAVTGAGGAAAALADATAIFSGKAPFMLDKF